MKKQASSHNPDPNFQRVPAMALLVLLSLMSASMLAGQLNRSEIRGEWEIQDTLADEASRVEKGSVAAVLWEARSGFSDVLWLKTDEYLHNGLQHQVEECNLDAELERVETAWMEGTEPGGHVHDEHCDHDHGHDHAAEHEIARAGEEPHDDVFFPREARPWQGVLGHLSEQTYPVGEHVHTKSKEELLPWFRLVTILNPRHTRAYRVGSFWLSSYVKDVTAGYEFALEGLEKNPEDPEMFFIVGRFHFYKFKDYEEAMVYFKKGIRAGFEIPESERSEAQHLAMIDSYRHIAYSQKALGNLDLARRATLLGLKVAPQDKALRLYLVTLNELLEENPQAQASPPAGTG